MMRLPFPNIGDRFDTLEVIHLRELGHKHIRSSITLKCVQCGFAQVSELRTLASRFDKLGWPKSKARLCPCCQNIGYVRGTAKIIGIVQAGASALKSIYVVEHICCGSREQITKHVLCKRSESIRRGCRLCNKRLAECHKRFQNTGRNKSPIYMPPPIELPGFISLGGGPGDILPAQLSYILSRSGL